MNKVFRQEWDHYRKDPARVSFRGVEPKPSATQFEGPVKVGEIRIFADMNRPFVALVLDDAGKFGYRIVPVSPFTVPASAREMLVGERVYQLWNACKAARRFVERSWVVDRLETIDQEELRAALGKIPSGAVSRDETAAEYEKAFRVAGGDFRFLQTEAKVKVAWWRRRATWGLAAMFMICCGIVGVLYEEELQDRREIAGREIARQVAKHCQEIASVTFSEPGCEVELAESAELDFPAELKCAAVSPSREESAVRCGAAQVACERRAARAVPRAQNINTHTCGESASRAPSAWPRPREVHAIELPRERYAVAAANGFKNPKEEPLSTFGLDVDTTSYALMRSSLTEYHRLPDADSVRIEEFVNYFKYDYPQPIGNDPIAADCELAACPWDVQHKLLRIGIQAKNVDEKELPPCNLTFLVDVSGSMMGEDRIGLLKTALKMLVGRLREQDHVAIVTYANETRVALPSVSGIRKREITDVIDGLVADGGTAGGEGLQLAYAEATKNFDKKANNRVILVTDGDFNIGISSPEELKRFIARKRESGIFLTVFGVGRGNFMDDNMKSLANAGNGNYAYLDSVLEAKKVMLTEFGGTLMTVAKDVKIQVEFNPAEVGRYRLLGYENRRLAARDFNDDKKDAGEIGSGHTMTAFYEIVPVGVEEEGVDPLKYQANEKKVERPAGASDELCTVKMRWKAPEGSVSTRRDLPIRAKAVTRGEPSENFRFASAVAEFALILRNSVDAEKAADLYKDVIERARDAKGSDREGYRAEFIRLVEQAEILYRENKPRRDRPTGSRPTWSSDVDVDVDI